MERAVLWKTGEMERGSKISLSLSYPWLALWLRSKNVSTQRNEGITRKSQGAKLENAFQRGINFVQWRGTRRRNWITRQRWWYRAIIQAWKFDYSSNSPPTFHFVSVYMCVSAMILWIYPYFRDISKCLHLTLFFFRQSWSVIRENVDFSIIEFLIKATRNTRRLLNCDWRVI